MKTIDEFGSVLAMATLLLGACAAVDGMFPSSAAGSAGSGPTFTDRGAPGFVAVAHRDRVILADQSRTEPAAGDVSETAPAGAVQQARLSW